MEELHKTAELYYNLSSENIKKLASDFYSEMDQNNDGQVSLQEYLAFMKYQGYTTMSNPSFFEKLKKQGNEETNLTFLEVMTLFYIIKSGRPFCDGCGDFINGMFFTCAKCFGSETCTFNVCVDCFRTGNFVHNHKDFVDNFFLLESKRVAGLKEVEVETRQTKSTPSNSCSECSEIVVADPRGRPNGWDLAFAALNAAANFVVQSCSIM